MSNTIEIIRKIQMSHMQKITEIHHLREIIIDLIHDVETQVISNTMNRDEMLKAIRKARNSIQ
jgi:hypothetical protein